MQEERVEVGIRGPEVSFRLCGPAHVMRSGSRRLKHVLDNPASLIDHEDHTRRRHGYVQRSALHKDTMRPRADRSCLNAVVLTSCALTATAARYTWNRRRGRGWRISRLQGRAARWCIGDRAVDLACARGRIFCLEFPGLRIDSDDQAIVGRTDPGSVAVNCDTGCSTHSFAYIFSYQRAVLRIDERRVVFRPLVHDPHPLA